MPSLLLKGSGYFSLHLFVTKMEHTTTTTEDYWVGGYLNNESIFQSLVLHCFFELKFTDSIQFEMFYFLKTESKHVS